jgi:phosphatidylserine decarboxylase
MGRQLEPMDPQLTSIQPGGGVVIHLEMAWGVLRRFWLKTFRRGYVKRMADSRQGEHNGCPHEVLDPRDLKFYRNQPGYWWRPEDDPFTGRDRLPFVRVGLAELMVFSALTWGPAGGLIWWLTSTRASSHLASQPTWITWSGWTGVALLVSIGLIIAWFFRNPTRVPPDDPHAVLAPADGKVVEIREIDFDEYIAGPAVQIGIFLSLFNVHINRSPRPARVIGLSYRRGKFLNAGRPEASTENEQLAVRLEETGGSERPLIVRQITGLIARRIVCWLKPGDTLFSGQVFGMIKLGSRTELVLPREDGLELLVELGQMVQAGTSVVARFLPDSGSTNGSDSNQGTSS